MMSVFELIDQLQHGDTITRRNAAAMLSWQPDTRAYCALVDAVLKDTDCMVRQQALRALGELRSPQAVQLIIEQVTADDEAIQMTAADILARVMSDDLIALLHDENTPTKQRAIAAWALGQCGNYPQIWAALQHASNSSEDCIREMAMSSLQHLQRLQQMPNNSSMKRRRMHS